MRARRLLIGVAIAALAAAARAEPARSPAGDPLTGRALFIGAQRLAGGGPPCGACHAIGGASAPFAAALGPELSKSFEGMDAPALEGILHDLPFPTMSPFYAQHALTASECIDLTAFLLQATGKPPPGGAAIAAWAAAVAAACLAAMWLAARGRKGSTRAALLARAAAPPPPRA
jgi:hypothetical protein